MGHFDMTDGGISRKWFGGGELKQIFIRLQKIHEVRVAYAVTLVSQRIQGEQVAGPSVAELRERLILALLHLGVRHRHRHLNVSVLVALARYEVAFELSDAPDAHRAALRQKVDEQRVFQRRAIEKDRADELDRAQTQKQADEINRRHDEKLEDARKELVGKLKDSREELVRSAGETVVREVETAKKEAKKQTLEGNIRDHLRGFSRTIPSFLMAYGDEETTLATFDQVIPADVFKEVTSVTVEQFCLLRDGGDVIDSETGEPVHFAGELFDPVVFDDSVKEFISLRSKLANYFDESLDEDIFDYVPPQKTNQIFAPRNVVVEMVDLFEKEKSGLYITEIVKRLYRSDGMRAAFPDDRERLDHILEKQVFGIAPTEIIYQIAIHYILGYDNEIGAGCDTNFVCADSAELAKEGKLGEFVEQAFSEKLGVLDGKKND